jgi:drug/metabolite transporter (DMT)-like permease
MPSEALALGSAFCIGLGSILLAQLKGRVPLVQLTRWQLVAAFGFTALASLLTDGWRGVTLAQAGLLGASGLVGIALASTTYFATIYTIGPRLTALLFTLSAPMTMGMGWLVLAEAASATQLAGAALVLTGVVVAVGLPTRPEGRTPLFRLGIATGLVTAFGQAAGTLLARPAMAEGVEPFTAMALRSAPAAALFLGLALVPSLGRGAAPVRSRPFGVAMAAALVGTVMGMTLMMAALHRGQVGIVSTLSSITPILVIPMAWLAFGERPTAAGWAGAGLAVAGVVLIGA